MLVDAIAGDFPPSVVTVEDLGNDGKDNALSVATFEALNTRTTEPSFTASNVLSLCEPQQPGIVRKEQWQGYLLSVNYCYSPSRQDVGYYYPPGRQDAPDKPPPAFPPVDGMVRAIAKRRYGDWSHQARSCSGSRPVQAL